jgi:hypothetical protein
MVDDPDELTDRPGSLVEYGLDLDMGSTRTIGAEGCLLWTVIPFQILLPTKQTRPRRKWQSIHV